MNLEELNLQIKSSSEKFRRLQYVAPFCTCSPNAHNKLFERALHAVPFTLMAAKAINDHQFSVPAMPQWALTHIAALPEINLKYCKRDASIIERI